MRNTDSLSLYGHGHLI